MANKRVVIDVLFAQSGYPSRSERRLTPESTQALFEKIGRIPHRGIPLHHGKDRHVIGRLVKADLLRPGDEQANIMCKVVITDSDLLDQNWLSLQQIARAAIYRGLEEAE